MAGWLPISSVASLMAEFNCYQAVIKNANILFIKPSLSKTHGQHSHASRLRDAHTDYHQRHALFCGFLGKVLCACYPAFTAGKDASDQSFDRSCKYDRPFLLPLFLKSWTTDEWWKKKTNDRFWQNEKIAESDLLNTCQYSNERKFIHQYKLSLSFFVCLFFFFFVVAALMWAKTKKSGRFTEIIHHSCWLVGDKRTQFYWVPGQVLLYARRANPGVLLHP